MSESPLAKAEVALGVHAGHEGVCPRCHANLVNIGLTVLAYTFETCECGKYSYAHLVETSWHRSCLADHWDEVGVL